MTVVASFYPLAEAAEKVGGELVQVTNLTPPGVEPHDLELNPDQVGAIQTADVVLYLGEDFQPAVQDAVSDANGTTVDLLQSMPLASPPPGQSGEGLAVDPHVWLDPVLYERIVDRVAAALSDAKPSAAQRFRRNARAFDVQIRSLDEQFRTGLSNCARDTIVTNHAAFGYLSDRYGLQQEPIEGISPEAEPDPKRLSELADLVRREGITTIFTEELLSPRVAETLANETGATTAALSPLEGLTEQEQQAGDDYLSVMRRNLDALERGLGCS